jgi:sulfatase maturation enzyme AslB (radical SAM superfamily)
MKPIIIPDSFNYIAVFLTFSCQLRCSYCINHHGNDLQKARWMDGNDWIKGLNRIKTRGDLPITLQGGEPTVHKHFFRIVDGMRTETPLDLLTNLEISAEKFMSSIPSSRFKREAKYASIRVSYHHEQSNFDKLISKVGKMQQRGYSIGIWEVAHPDYISDVHQRQHLAKHMGLDYRIKEFLGPWKGKNYGTMRYPNAVNSSHLRNCDCRTSELLVDPRGNIFRCHSDLYANRLSIGHILDKEPPALGEWKPCAVYGRCNSCDIKLKTNRFQEYGHSSVEIRNVGEPTNANEQVETPENTYGKHDPTSSNSARS